MQYCAIVEQQLSLWNTKLCELSKEFHTVRKELSKYQQDLFCKFQQQRISTSIALAYLGESSSSSSITQKEDEGEAACIFLDLLQKDSTTSTTAEGVVPSSPPSPMKSTLLVSSKIMEKLSNSHQNSNNDEDNGWTETLAVVTSDSVLHFFDIPRPSSSYCNNKSPQEVFNKVFLSAPPSHPDHHVEQEEELPLLQSSTSIYLPNCSHCHKVRTISNYQEDLEIMEACLDKDRCFTTRKILLRSESSHETLEWSNSVFSTLHKR